MGSEKQPPIFACTLCGDCCQGYGGTYLDANDVNTIATRLGLSPQSFVERYCVEAGQRRMRAQGPDGFCVFYEKKCTIHPIKPRMCRTWPYLKSVLVDYNNWHAMASMCPGIRADAPPAQVLAEIASYHDLCQEDQTSDPP